LALIGLRKPVLLLAPRKTVDVGAVAIAGVDDGALVGGLVPIMKGRTRFFEKALAMKIII